MPTNISVNFLLKTTKISVNLIGHFHCQNQNSLKHNKIKASFWSQKMLCIEIHRSPLGIIEQKNALRILREKLENCWVKWEK
jgi:hypothetical protein